MKTYEQVIDEVTAAMADLWLAACDRRVIAPTLDNRAAIVLDLQGNVRIFGPASAGECRLFVHRAAARDVLVALGTQRVSDAAMTVASNGRPPALNG